MNGKLQSYNKCVSSIIKSKILKMIMRSSVKIVIIILLISCQFISEKEKNSIKRQVMNFFNYSVTMNEMYIKGDSLFKIEMKLHNDSLFYKTIKEEMYELIGNGTLGSCYYSSYTKENENREIYNQTISKLNKNTFLYEAEVTNYYSVYSDYDHIDISSFKGYNITNTTYTSLTKKINDFYSKTIPFTFNVNLKELV